MSSSTPGRPAWNILCCVHQPPSPSALREAAIFVPLRPLMKLLKGSRSGGPPILPAKLELCASRCLRARVARSCTSLGATASKQSKLPSSIITWNGEGVFQPILLAEATMAPAGPTTSLKGLEAPATWIMACFHVALSSSSGTSLSHTALAQWTMGSTAMRAPTSYFASWSLANVDLPRICPIAPHEKLLAALIVVLLTPKTAAPYLMLGWALPQF